MELRSLIRENDVGWGEGSRVQEMRVVGVGLERGAGQPVLLLQEVRGQRRLLPVWIATPEAVVIDREQQHVAGPRPVTHHLIAQVIGALGRRLDRVCITELREGIFHAQLMFDADVAVSARPSDAVALALHLGAPIHAEDLVLERAAVSGASVIVPDDSEPVNGVGQADEVERFRRFLDSASPEDFDTS